MLSPKIIILLISTFVLLSMTNKHNKATTKFRTKVENYINSLSPSYKISSETMSVLGNDIILNTKVRTKWKKEISVEHNPNAENDKTKYPKMYYGFYQYSNKNKCSIALDSLLNCFGNDCIKLKWSNEQEYFSSMLSIYIINDSEIIVCKVQPTYEHDFWNSVQSEFKNKFAKENSRIIKVDHNGLVSFQN